MSDPILYEYILAPGPDGRYGMLPGGQPPRASIAMCPKTYLTAVATDQDEKSKLKRDKLAVARLEVLKRVQDFPADLSQVKDVVEPEQRIPDFITVPENPGHCPKCGGLGQRMTKEARRLNMHPMETIETDWEPCPYCSWKKD